MGYKKFWTSPTSGQVMTNTVVITRLNNIVNEFALAGVVRTNDSGQFDINAFDMANIIKPSPNKVIGFLMFKVFDNCLLKLEIKMSIATGGTGNMVLVPILGSTTDGAGNFIGATAGNSSIGINTTGDLIGDSLAAGQSTSILYKSDNTFWFILDIDKNESSSTLTGRQYRLTSVAFITKTVDDTFSVVDDAFHCYIMTTSSTSGTPINEYVKSFTPPDENGITQKNNPLLNSSYSHSFVNSNIINSNDPVYFIQPVLGTINGKTGFNYDMLFVRNNALIPSTQYQEITLNVNGTNRKYMLIWNGTGPTNPSGYQLFNFITTAPMLSVLIWD